MQDHLIHTLAWKREPSHAVFPIDGPDPALPAVLCAAAAGLVAALVALPSERYALSLTLVWARTLAYGENRRTRAASGATTCRPFSWTRRRSCRRGWGIFLYSC